MEACDGVGACIDISYDPRDGVVHNCFLNDQIDTFTKNANIWGARYWGKKGTLKAPGGGPLQ